jgi:hypothetical protein
MVAAIGTGDAFAKGRDSDAASESYIKSDFGFEVIDRVVLNDWYTDLQGEGSVVIQLASDPRVERKKKPSGLAGDWIAEIYANVRAWIERDEPRFRKAKSEQRRELQVADVSFCRIAREANVVPCIRLKIASGTNFGQPIAETCDGHYLPLSGAESVPAGWGDETRTKASRPTTIEVIGVNGLNICVT